MTSIATAFAQWKESVGNHIPADDGPMMAESWNNYTDQLCKDGELGALQYRYAPAYDSDMPSEGRKYNELSGDREFILDAMGVKLASVFVPFSQSRNRDDKSPSLNWRVTLKYAGKDVLICDYMQGCANCPSYKNPVKFPTGRRDDHLTKIAIARECETGKILRHTVPSSPNFMDVGKIDGPDVAEVLYSLLQDAQVLNCRDFADWCDEVGMEDDSIRARGIYDACVADSLKLHAAFGKQMITDLQELFEDM